MPPQKNQGLAHHSSPPTAVRRHANPRRMRPRIKARRNFPNPPHPLLLLRRKARPEPDLQPKRRVRLPQPPEAVERAPHPVLDHPDGYPRRERSQFPDPRERRLRRLEVARHVRGRQRPEPRPPRAAPRRVPHTLEHVLLPPPAVRQRRLRVGQVPPQLGEVPRDGVRRVPPEVQPALVQAGLADQALADFLQRRLLRQQQEPPVPIRPGQLGPSAQVEEGVVVRVV
ncbi:uncharacterized protein PG986_006201 [Apiospora aurea]|uniref:Uncharacterized protein n=1 Tax=Apiospora aurea TaxID=335848 RepID=A0ABR1QJQ7_9PEZI